MQIEHLAAVIRPRTPWEGLDLGFALGRRWFPALFGLWWSMALPVGALGALWLPDSPSLWLLLVWWFKPLYEAPVLFWLSRRLFGDALGPRELWRARRQILPVRLLPNLLWRRLHPSRSLQMSLLLLEGLGGKARRQRQRILQGTGGTAAWLTVVCVHMESILWISSLLLIAFLIPEQLPGFDLGAALLAEDSTPYWISTLAYWFAMSAIAPFYVAAGFAFYLTRRTELEAWDLELQFRRVNELPWRRPRRAPRNTAATALVLVLVLAAGFTAPPQPAAAAVTLTRAEAKAEIESVLGHRDFGGTREIQTWVYVGPEPQQGEGGELPDWLLDLLRSLGQGADLAAALFKWILILAAGVLVVVILQRILRDLRKLPRSAPAPSRGEPPTRHLTTRVPDEMPTDVAGAVEGLIARGDLRGALSLLYGASILLLHRRHGLQVPESATESEFLVLVRTATTATEWARMRRLVLAWQRLAYAHREPAAAELDALVRDWERWQEMGHAG